MSQPWVGVLFYIAHRHAENVIHRGLAEAGFDDFTLPQARLLARIDEGGSRITKLAESAQVTKQTAGYLVDQLERLGYVERVPDPSDARARLVRPAARAHAAAEVARRLEREIDAEWTAHLGEKRMAALREDMVALREITDPYL